MKNEMGWVCSKYGRDERRILGFGGETLGKKNTRNKWDFKIKIYFEVLG